MINQITQIRLPDGKMVAMVDWSARPLYSTVDILTGMNDEEIRAFNYAESDTVSSSANIPAAGRRVASLRDTNISGASEMDSTEEFLVYAIKVEVHQFHYDIGSASFLVDEPGLPVPSGPVLSLLQNRFVLELEVSEKAFPQAGLGWFTQGFGPTIAVSSTASTRTYANNGAQSHEAADQLPLPVHLGGTEDYAVILHNPPGGAAQGGGGAITFPDEDGGDLADASAQIRVYLCGLHKRPTA